MKDSTVSKIACVVLILTIAILGASCAPPAGYESNTNVVQNSQPSTGDIIITKYEGAINGNNLFRFVDKTYSTICYSIPSDDVIWCTR